MGLSGAVEEQAPKGRCLLEPHLIGRRESPTNRSGSPGAGFIGDPVEPHIM